MDIPGVAHMIEDLINVLIVESKHLYNKIVHNIRQGHSQTGHSRIAKILIHEAKNTDF